MVHAVAVCRQSLFTTVKSNAVHFCCRHPKAQARHGAVISSELVVWAAGVDVLGTLDGRRFGSGPLREALSVTEVELLFLRGEVNDRSNDGLLIFLG